MATITEVIMQDGQLISKIPSGNYNNIGLDTTNVIIPGPVNDSRGIGTSDDDTLSNRIFKIFLHEDADGLRDFFDTVMSKHHMFKVATTRCYNLIHALYGNTLPSEKGIIGGDALLMYAKDFAERYACSGTFPSVLVVTDTFVTGQTVYDILDGMEHLVYEILQERKDLNPNTITWKNVRLGMLSATDIVTYAGGKPSERIDSIYLHKVNVTCQSDYNDVTYNPNDPFALELSYKINNFLRYCGKIVDTRLLSTKVDTNIVESLRKSKWDQYELEYRRCPGILFSKRDETGTLRMAYAFGTEKAITHIVGIPCIDRISCERLDSICEEFTREVIDTHRDDKFAHIMSMTCLESFGYKISLMHLIDSAETLRMLALDIDMAWNEVLAASNMERIFCCFGLESDTSDVIRRIVKTTEVLRKYSQHLRQEGTWDYRKVQENTSIDISETIRRYEDILCRASMEKEIISYQYSHNLATPPLISPLLQRCGDVTHSDFMRHMAKDGFDVNSIMLVACEMLMLQHGLCYTRYIISKSTNDIIYCISASRLATCIISRRHLSFFGTLPHLQFCWNIYSSPKSLICEFIDELANDTEVIEHFGQAWIDGIKQDVPWYVDIAYEIPSVSRYTSTHPGDSLLLRGITLSLYNSTPPQFESQYYENLLLLHKKAQEFICRRQRELIYNRS